jgi:GNAT superfamily N-acetyltransferase
VSGGIHAVVRAAEGRDVIALAEVYVASWRASYRGIVPDAILDGLSTVAQTARWQKMLAGTSKSGARAFVIEDADPDGERAIRGFAVTGPVRGERPADAPACGEIWAIYFEPEAWRRGLGRAIVAAAERDLRARGFPETVVWVLAKNARARSFFEGTGWRSTGEMRANPMGGTVLEEIRFHRGT